MRYDLHYKKLIATALKREKPKAYLEKHHILPLCLGGKDLNNLVWLTGREHYVAHLLLAKMHGGRLWLASSLMGVRFKRQSSRMYEKSKAEMSEKMKMVGKRNQEKGLGIFGRSTEQKKIDGQIGGKKQGKETYLNKTGVHARTKEQMTADALKMVEKHKEAKTGMFDPKHVEAKSRGGKKPWWYNPETGKTLRDYECPAEGFLKGRGKFK